MKNSGQFTVVSDQSRHGRNLYFAGCDKPIIVQYPDNLEILRLDHPLSYKLLVRSRSDFLENEELLDRMRHFKVRGRAFTTRLRTWWTAFILCLRRFYNSIDAWSPNARLAGICDLWLKVAVIAGAIWILGEIAWAFRPGGAVERVLGGVR